MPANLHPHAAAAVHSAARGLTNQPATVPQSDIVNYGVTDAHGPVQTLRTDRGHLQHAGAFNMYPTAPPPPEDFRNRLSWTACSHVPGSLTQNLPALPNSRSANVSDSCPYDQMKYPVVPTVADVAASAMPTQAGLQAAPASLMLETRPELQFTHYPQDAYLSCELLSGELDPEYFSPFESSAQHSRAVQESQASCKVRLEMLCEHAV